MFRPTSAVERLIEAAIDEDLGERGDITSSVLANAGEPASGRVDARAPGVICGLELAPAIAGAFNRRLGFCDGAPGALRIDAGAFRDGDSIQSGQTVADVRGARAAILAMERTLLNFLSRLSGVATLTRRFVQAVRDSGATCAIVDTRKTIPGWRELDKYAVRIGGGRNHRFGLHDAILIKDNHLAGIPTPGLAPALFHILNRVAELPGHKPDFVEVEVDSLKQLVEVFKVVGVDLILLDNFTLEDMRAAVQLRDSHGLRQRVALEVSGGVTLDHVGEIARTGVDRIAVGALTHSAPALDMGLDF